MALFSNLLRSKPYTIHRNFSSIYRPTDKQKIQQILCPLKSNTKEILKLCHAATIFHHENKTLLDHLNLTDSSRAFVQELKTRPSLLNSFLDELKLQTNLRNENFFTYCITLYGQAGMFSHAVLAFEEMVRLNISPSTNSFNALLAALLGMDKDCFSPGFSILGTKLESNNQWGLSLSLLVLVARQMVRYGCEPDETTHNLILTALNKEKRLERVAEIVEVLDRDGMPLSISIYNLCFDHLCKKRRTAEAREIYARIFTRGLKPNAETYRLLLCGFGAEGNVKEIRRIIQDMSAMGIVPDKNIIGALIHSLTQCGDTELVKKLCKGSTDVLAWKILLDRLNASKFQDASKNNWEKNFVHRSEKLTIAGAWENVQKVRDVSNVNNEGGQEENQTVGHDLEKDNAGMSEEINKLRDDLERDIAGMSEEIRKVGDDSENNNGNITEGFQKASHRRIRNTAYVTAAWCMLSFSVCYNFESIFF